jgi:hypothetical protein
MTLRTKSRRLAMIAGAFAFAVVGGLAATNSLDARAAAPEDKWLKSSTAKHRQLFDFPASGGGIPLVHIMNYYDTWNKAYGVADKDINTIGTFYGSTTFHGVNDAMWAKYKLGEFLNEKDASGMPHTKNPWRLSGMVAKARGLNEASVYEDMKSNILPGVELIPGMVVAIEQAHKAGIAYHRQ